MPKFGCAKCAKPPAKSLNLLRQVCCAKCAKSVVKSLKTLRQVCAAYVPIYKYIYPARWAGREYITYWRQNLRLEHRVRTGVEGERP